MDVELLAQSRRCSILQSNAVIAMPRVVDAGRCLASYLGVFAFAFSTELAQHKATAPQSSLSMPNTAFFERAVRLTTLPRIPAAKNQVISVLVSHK